MRTPRRVRPDKITIHNPTGAEDEDLNKVYLETVIEYVAVKLNSSSSGGKTGFNKEDAGVAVIDLSDLVAKRDDIPVEYTLPEDYTFGYTTFDFTIRDSIDLIEYKGKKYQVKRIEYHYLFSRVKPAILEVYF